MAGRFGREVVVANFSHKINLASFGNMVPHLPMAHHSALADDRHFPEPVWGKVKRGGLPGSAIPVVSDELGNGRWARALGNRRTRPIKMDYDTSPTAAANRRFWTVLDYLAQLLANPDHCRAAIAFSSMPWFYHRPN